MLARRSARKMVMTDAARRSARRYAGPRLREPLMEQLIPSKQTKMAALRDPLRAIVEMKATLREPLREQLMEPLVPSKQTKMAALRDPLRAIVEMKATTREPPREWWFRWYR